MAEKTTNLGLIKPTGTEYFDIRHFNDNADKIDREITEIKKNIEDPVSWDKVTDKPESYNPSGHNHIWDEITDKPESYTPDTHTHSTDDITGVLPVSKGGTGAVNADAAIKALLYRGEVDGINRVDANTLTNTGLYFYCGVSSTDNLNLPSVGIATVYGYLLTLAGYGAFASQMFFHTTRTELYIRTTLGGEWSEWKKVTTA